jgi:pilus assembly protein CpaB
MQSRVLAIVVAVVLALVATAALVVYVNGADRRAISNQEPVVVFVAAQTIKAGTRGEEAVNREFVERREMPRSSVARDAVKSVSQIVDQFAAVDIVKDEVLLKQRWVGAEEVTGRRLLQIPEGHQAISIELELTRQVAGFVTPGDNVSLILSMKRPGPGGGEPVDRSQFLLHNIRVLAVATTALANSSTQNGGRVSQGRGSQTLTAVTLAVKPADAERVAYAAEFGKIYLTLLPPDPGAAPGGDGSDAGDVIPARQQ